MLTNELKNELLSCINPRLDLGPKGGFHSFSYLFQTGGGSLVPDKKLAMECVELLRQNGREVKEFREKPSLKQAMNAVLLDATTRW